MKVSFYIKLFIAFVIFAILLLGFSSFAFNNFYTFHNEKKHKEQNYNILNHQEDIFKTYLKNYDEKLWLLKNTLSNFKDEEKKIEFLKIFLKEDKNIKLFKIVSLDANEKLKIEKQNDDINIYKPNQLKRIFTSSYYKDIRVLKNREILHYISSSSTIKFILRNEDSFYILKIDLKEIFSKIYNNFSIKTVVFDSSEKLNKDSFYKEIFINEKQYYTFVLQDILTNKDNYIKDYYESVIVIGFCMALLLSLLFSEPIAKLNKKVEEENKKLDLDIKQNFLELNENQRVIDKHIMFVRLDKNYMIIDASEAFCYFLGFSKGELIGHSYEILIHKDMKIKERIKILKYLKNKKSYIAEIKGNKKDGEVFWINLFIETIFENEQIVGYTIICTDITNKKRLKNYT